MHFDQRADEGKPFQAAVDPVAYGVADLEALFIEVEFERAVFTLFVPAA